MSVFDVDEGLCLLLLAQLDELGRNVVVGYYWRSDTEAAIGERLGLDRERVHRVRRTAEARMRRYIEQRGLSELVRDTLGEAA